MATVNGVQGKWESADAEDIREGDIVRVEGKWNGWGGVTRTVEVRPDDTVKRFIPDVPKPTVPTEPGLYRDVDGDLWFLTSNLDWQLSTSGDEFEIDDDPEIYLPFTKINL